MGRPRKPTNLLLLSGAARRNPGRLQGRATKRADGTWEEEVVAAPGLGDPPSCFQEDECARWLELQEISPAGVLTQMDRPAAELLCKLWAASRRNSIASTDRKLLVSLFGKFGLTPSERSKVGGLGRPPRRPANPFLLLDSGNK